MYITASDGEGLKNLEKVYVVRNEKREGKLLSAYKFKRIQIFNSFPKIFYLSFHKNPKFLR